MVTRWCDENRTLDVRSLVDTLQDFVRAWDAGEVSGPRISFETPALLFKLLTGKRWELLKAMTGGGPMTVVIGQCKRVDSFLGKKYRPTRHGGVLLKNEGL